ncbi:MAG: hypothetical protein B7Y02_00670 [Rhodobacterales bacterium 17-64-5]|nr:MAG: hypothetical protein B7Y02_00670 [Rhodobacterales bacterium 17-64-5]
MMLIQGQDFRLFYSLLVGFLCAVAYSSRAVRFYQGGRAFVSCSFMLSGCADKAMEFACEI